MFYCALSIFALASVAFAENPSPVTLEPPTAVHRELARQASSSVTQPISHPAAGEKVILDSTFTIKWTPKVGTKITIQIWNDDGVADIFGETCDNWIVNSRCGQIATSVENTGSFEWHVPYMDCWTDSDTEDSFYLYTFVNDFYQPGVNDHPVLTYSGKFNIESKQQAAGGGMQCNLLSTIGLPSSPPSSSPVQNIPPSSPTPKIPSEPADSSTTYILPPLTTGFGSESSTTSSPPEASSPASSRRATTTTPIVHSSLVLSSTTSAAESSSEAATSSVAIATGSGSTNAQNMPWGISVLFSFIFSVLI